METPYWGEARWQVSIAVAVAVALQFPLSGRLVLPLSRWAKMGMTVQASVSIVTVALVVARAVNILK